MSLKAFHIVFITVASALAVGCGIWSLKNYYAGETGWNLVFGLGSLVAGAGLVVYGRFFLKKLKKISYL
jgi:hypothetical protein